MTTNTLLPTRFTLSAAQASAALAMAGVTPTDRSLWKDVKPKAGAKALEGTELVADGKLTPEAEAAIRVAADPKTALSVIINRPGTTTAGTQSFMRGEDDTLYAMLAQDGDGWDMALLTSTAQATVAVDDALKLSVLPSDTAKEPLTLDLPAYSALLAGADALEAARLTQRLYRQHSPLPSLTTSLLEGHLAQGMTTVDQRWAVTAARFVSPVDVGAAAGRMDVGLESLREAGLLEQAASGYNLTRRGYEVMGRFGHFASVSALLLATATDKESGTLGVTNIFRSLASVWLAVWTDIAPTEGTVQFGEVSSAGALQAVRQLLEHGAG